LQPGINVLLLSGIAGTSDGKRGFIANIYAMPPSAANRKLIEEIHVEKSVLGLIDYDLPGIADNTFHIDLEATLIIEGDDKYQLGLYV